MWSQVAIVMVLSSAMAQPPSTPTSVTNFLSVLVEHDRSRTLLLIDCVDVETIMGGGGLKQLQLPVVLATRDTPIFAWKQHFNDDLLTLQCLSATRGDIALSALDDLALRLHHMRQSHIVLHIEQRQARTELALELSVAGYLRRCAALHMLNVVAVLDNFAANGRVYAFDNFPQFRLQRRAFPAQRDFFPNKLHDVGGHPLYTLPNQKPPRSFLYRDADGVLQVSGYIGKLMQSFAAFINATLRFPYTPTIGDSIDIMDLVNYTRAGLVDIVMGLSPYKMPPNTHEISIFVEISPWRIMLPVEARLSVADMYFLLLSSELTVGLAVAGVALSVVLTWQQRWQRPATGNFWLQALLNDRSFRGLLGQPFPAAVGGHRTNAIIVQILLMGLIASSMYAGYLNTLLTHPPTQPRIESFEHLRHSRVKILLTEHDRPIVVSSRSAAFWKRYERCFFIVPTWVEYMQHRRSLNTTYGYLVPNSVWSFIAKRQALTSQKRFRLSRRMILHDTAMFGLPLQDNSIYRPALNRFLLHASEANLMNYWRMCTFFDMQAMGNISRGHFVEPSEDQALCVHDLLWVWLLYGLGVLLAVAAWLCELLVDAHGRARAKKNASGGTA